MKTIKHILATVLLATGLTASAQTQDNVPAAKAKQPVSKNMRKVKTNERVKAMPASKVKEGNETESIQTEKQTEQKSTTTGKGGVTTVAPANTTNKTEKEKVSTDKKTGENKNEKMKEIKRPVKMESTPKSGK